MNKELIENIKKEIDDDALWSKLKDIKIYIKGEISFVDSENTDDCMIFKNGKRNLKLGIEDIENSMSYVIV